MKIQREKFIPALAEIQALLPLHYEELALNKDKVPLSPMYEIYQEHEDRGNLLFVTVRDETQKRKIVGYFIGIIAPGLHYRTCITCTMDIFFIHPEYRGAALLGLKLFRKVEAICRDLGVDRMYVGSKVKADASILFERLGYGRIEVYYSKWIGE